MAKTPTTPRGRGEDHSPDDAFVTAIKRTYAWGRKNSRPLSIGATVVVVVVAAFLWYTNQQGQLERQAASRLTQVQQSLAAGNPELAIRDLQEFVDRFGATRTADQARLILASVLLDQDRAQEAVATIEDLSDDLAAPLGIAAARLRAAAFEHLDRADDAVDIYVRIGSDARFAYERREGLTDAARVRLQSGDADAAASLYQRVIDTLPEDSPQRAYYEMWLAEARARAQSGAAPVQGAEEATPDSAG